jgi:hypothetical protein
VNELADMVKKTGIECYVAGSSGKPGQIVDAINDGFNIGITI